MKILEHLQWRYATKKFNTNRKLPEHKVALLKEAFNLTATSYGLQPVKLLVIADEVLQRDLVKHSMGQKQVGDASHVLVFCVVTDISETYIRSYFDRVKNIRHTPDDILSPYRDNLVESFKKQSQEEIHTWATHRAYLAMGNLLTVCAVEGIDSCPMEGFDPQSYDKTLQLGKQGLRSVLVMPVGYRASDDPSIQLKKVRKSLNESIINL